MRREYINDKGHRVRVETSGLIYWDDRDYVKQKLFLTIMELVPRQGWCFIDEELNGQKINLWTHFKNHTEAQKTLDALAAAKGWALCPADETSLFEEV